MKKICLAVALSFAFATPVLACPSMDGDAKTAKSDKSDKKTGDKSGTAQKDDANKAKPAEAPKKTGDKVSMK